MENQFKVQEIEFGTIISTTIERYKATEGNDVISIVPDLPIIRAEIHYIEEIQKSIYCFGDVCCKVAGDNPKVYYILPIVHYTSIDLTTPNLTWEERVKSPFLKYLRASKDIYEKLVTKQQLKGDMRGIDFVVTCTDANFQKMDFHDVEKSVWLKNPEMKQFIESFYEDYRQKIEQTVAKKYDKQTFLKLLAKSQTSNQTGFNYNAQYGINVPQIPQAPQIPQIPNLNGRQSVFVPPTQQPIITPPVQPQPVPQVQQPVPPVQSQPVQPQPVPPVQSQPVQPQPIPLVQSQPESKPPIEDIEDDIPLEALMAEAEDL